jgi:uncharacterized protein
MSNTASTVVPLQEHESWTKGGGVVSHLEDSEISRLEERAAVTVADSSTLGLWGFATGTWMTGTVIAGVFPISATTAVIPVLLVFAGLTQFIAGLFAFRRAHVLPATAFCAYGAFNVTTAMFFGMQAAGVLGTTGAPIILQGFLLESFGLITLALVIAALRTNAALILTLGALMVGYTLAGIPNLANAVGQPGWMVVQALGGWFLVASAALAFYTGMALVVNSTWHRTVLPLGGEP